MTQDEAKRMAATRALEFVEDGMALGLGTGSTAAIFIQELGERVKAGAARSRRRHLGCQPCTRRVALPSHDHLRRMPDLDLAIDGADEVGPVSPSSKAAAARCSAKRSSPAPQGASSSSPTPPSSSTPSAISSARRSHPDGPADRRAESSKRSASTQTPPSSRQLPSTHRRGQLHPRLRLRLHSDPAKTAAEIRAIVGVVEHGLFLNMASLP